MMFLKTITLEHTPPSHSVHISLFRDIKNATFLLEQLRSGNVEYEYALLDARVILSSVHLLSACFRAIHCNITNRLRTRNIHSEIVYALSPRNNITTAFVNFGITDQTRDLIIVKVGDLTLHDSVKDHLSKIIEGDAEKFSDDTLANITDWTRVHKLYSVMEKRQLQKLRNNGDLNIEEKTEIELLILGAMALKSATN